jgi:hypothetical protein
LVVQQGLFRNLDGQVMLPIGAEDDFVLEWRDRPFREFLAAVQQALD